MNRSIRYQQVADLLTPILTNFHLRRLEATMDEAYAKVRASGAPEESLAQTAQMMAEKAHAFGAAETAKRIHQWTLAILEAQEIDNNIR